MSSVSPVIHFESDEAKKTAAGAMFVAVPCERPRFRSCDKCAAPFLFQVHVGSPLLVYSLLLVNTFVADFVYAKRSEQRLCQLRFDTPIFETIRIISNVAARLPPDVTRCIAQLSAYDEISALIRPTHLHHSSY